MALPAWTAGTAYLTGARITKVVPDTTVWLAQTSGTSGGVEPTWPVVDPWTVVDGGVTWGLASSLRTSTVTGIISVLTSFRSANPTLLKGISRARPKSLTNFDLPGAYLGTRDDPQIAIMHDIRQRTIAGGVVLVDLVPDNLEAEARMDILVDGMVDAFTLNYHAVSGQSILAPVSVAEVPFDEGGIEYLANVLAYSVRLAEGRT